MCKDKLEAGVKKTGLEKELLTENCFLLKLISMVMRVVLRLAANDGCGHCVTGFLLLFAGTGLLGH